MLFFRDIYDLNETKTIYFAKPTDVAMATTRFNMAAKFNFQQITFKKVRWPPIFISQNVLYCQEVHFVEV